MHFLQNKKPFALPLLLSPLWHYLSLWVWFDCIGWRLHWPLVWLLHARTLCWCVYFFTTDFFYSCTSWVNKNILLPHPENMCPVNIDISTAIVTLTRLLAYLLVNGLHKFFTIICHLANKSVWSESHFKILPVEVNSYTSQVTRDSRCIQH